MATRLTLRMYASTLPGALARAQRNTSVANVYVNGPDRFSAELIRYVLDRELGINAIAVDDIESLPSKVSRSAETGLLLVGAGQGQVRHMVEALLVKSPAVFAGVSVALFDVEPDLNGEAHSLRNGVRGIFYRGDTLDHFVKGVQALLDGDVWHARKVLVHAAMARNTPPAVNGREDQLTRRERQVLALVSTGASNEEIAQKLFISSHTVKTHLYNVFKKIDVPNRLQAALWAAKNL